MRQSELQLGDLERQAQIDVERAVLEYQVTRREVEELLQHVEPPAAQIRDNFFKLWQDGASSVLEYLDAQQNYNTIAKQVLDTAVRHRRSMLSLNTVVGRKIMP